MWFFILHVVCFFLNIFLVIKYPNSTDVIEHTEENGEVRYIIHKGPLIGFLFMNLILSGLCTILILFIMLATYLDKRPTFEIKMKKKVDKEKNI